MGWHRSIGRRASTVLLRPSSASRLTVHFAAPPGNSGAPCHVILNGVNVGTIARADSDWQREEFSLPNDGLRIVQVEFRVADPEVGADRLLAIQKLSLA